MNYLQDKRFSAPLQKISVSMIALLLMVIFLLSIPASSSQYNKFSAQTLFINDNYTYIDTNYNQSRYDITDSVNTNYFAVQTNASHSLFLPDLIEYKDRIFSLNSTYIDQSLITERNGNYLNTYAEHRMFNLTYYNNSFSGLGLLTFKSDVVNHSTIFNRDHVLKESFKSNLFFELYNVNKSLSNFTLNWYLAINNKYEYLQNAINNTIDYAGQNLVFNQKITVVKQTMDYSVLTTKLYVTRNVSVNYTPEHQFYRLVRSLIYSNNITAIEKQTLTNYYIDNVTLPLVSVLQRNNNIQANLLIQTSFYDLQAIYDNYNTTSLIEQYRSYISTNSTPGFELLSLGILVILPFVKKNKREG